MNVRSIDDPGLLMSWLERKKEKSKVRDKFADASSLCNCNLHFFASEIIHHKVIINYAVDALVLLYLVPVCMRNSLILYPAAVTCLLRTEKLQFILLMPERN